MATLEFILLIDDSDADNYFHKIVINRSLPGLVLRSINNSVHAFDYLQKCLSMEKPSEYPLPQLIFIDINMPALNGFELLSKLRAQSDPYDLKKDIKIYMLTGSLNPDDKARAQEEFAGMISGFCIKPLTDSVFKEIVKSHF